MGSVLEFFETELFKEHWYMFKHVCSNIYKLIFDFENDSYFKYIPEYNCMLGMSVLHISNLCYYTPLYPLPNQIVIWTKPPVMRVLSSYVLETHPSLNVTIASPKILKYTEPGDNSIGYEWTSDNCIYHYNNTVTKGASAPVRVCLVV